MKAGTTPIRSQILDEFTQGILPITKSVQFHLPPTVLGWASYSAYGFKFDNVQLYGVAGWAFPGHLDKPYYSCGEIMFLGCLSSAHPGVAYARPVRGNCGRAGCPICYRTWLIDTTKKVEYRIKQAIKQLQARGYHRTSPIHVTVNPAPHLWPRYRDPKRYPKLRRKAQRIAKKAGFDGGAMIFHSYRERCAKCGGSIGFKDKTCTRCGCEDRVWYWSPHWHLFGFGWIQGTRALAEASGYVVKNHGIRSDIAATAYYQLSHCGIREGRHAVTWFGVLHYSKLRIPPMPDDTDPAKMHCPLCGQRLRRLRYHGTKPPPESPDCWPASDWELVDVYPRVEHTKHAGGEHFS